MLTLSSKFVLIFPCAYECEIPHGLSLYRLRLHCSIIVVCSFNEHTLLVFVEAFLPKHMAKCAWQNDRTFIISMAPDQNVEG